MLTLKTIVSGDVFPILNSNQLRCCIMHCGDARCHQWVLQWCAYILFNERTFRWDFTLWILKPRLKVLSLKSMYANHQTAHQWHQRASPQWVIQHFSWFELRIGEAIVFIVCKLPLLEVTDNMKNILYISTVNSAH